MQGTIVWPQEIDNVGGESALRTMTLHVFG
jgi:hypothetical protein